jgi:hypothetical protein
VIRLYSASGLHEAYILLGLLRQERIAARVLNVNAQGGLGEIPFAQTYPEIWIDDDRDAVRARGVIDAFRAAPRPAGARVCPACGEESPGNFESCWNCSAALP